MNEPINQFCPWCIGEGECFDDQSEDWRPCAHCKGTGKRKDIEE